MERGCLYYVKVYFHSYVYFGLFKLCVIKTYSHRKEHSLPRICLKSPMYLRLFYQVACRGSGWRPHRSQSNGAAPGVLWFTQKIASAKADLQVGFLWTIFIWGRWSRGSFRFPFCGLKKTSGWGSYECILAKDLSPCSTATEPQTNCKDAILGGHRGWGTEHK